MSKRKGRKRKAGRKVYYKRFSLATAKDIAGSAKQMRAEANARARILSPENVEQRLRRETRLEDGMIKTLGLRRDNDNEPRELALNKLAEYQRLDMLDRHMVVFQGLRFVRILFYNKQETEYWIVERNKITGELRRSIVYGSREVAMILEKVGRVKYQQ